MSITNIIDRFFPTPRFLAMPAVSLAVTDQAVRLVQLKAKRGMVRLESYDEQQLPSTAIVKGQMEEPQSVTTILNNWRRQYGLKFVTGSLPEERGFIYTLDLSLVAKETDEIREYISFTFEENVPLALNEAVFDFDILQLSSTQPPRAVVFAFNRKTIEQHLKVFQQAGLSVLSFEPESRALARAVIDRNDRRVQAILYLKQDLANISIVVCRQVVFTSTVYKGLADLTATTDDESQFWLKSELEKVLRYWNSRQAGSLPMAGEVENLIICGEGVGRKEVLDHVLTQLNSEPEPANVWKNVTSFNEYVPEISYQTSFDYGVAIGLALESLT